MTNIEIREAEVEKFTPEAKERCIENTRQYAKDLIAESKKLTANTDGVGREISSARVDDADKNVRRVVVEKIIEKKIKPNKAKIRLSLVLSIFAGGAVGKFMDDLSKAFTEFLPITLLAIVLTGFAVYVAEESGRDG